MQAHGLLELEERYLHVFLLQQDIARALLGERVLEDAGDVRELGRVQMQDALLRAVRLVGRQIVRVQAIPPAPDYMHGAIAISWRNTAAHRCIGRYGNTAATASAARDSVIRYADITARYTRRLRLQYALGSEVRNDQRVERLEAELAVIDSHLRLQRVVWRRYSVGVWPVWLRKLRMKCWGLPKPQVSLMRSTLWPVEASS